MIYRNNRYLDKQQSNEQSFMISVSDIMVGMLFLFIIMIAYFTYKFRLEQQKRLSDVDPRGYVTSLIGAEIKRSMPDIRIDPSNGIITLPEELLFDIGSSVIKPSVVNKLRDISNKLETVIMCFVANQRVHQDCSKNPHGHEIETIFIEGHTDNRPMLKDGGNIKLSLDRALSVNAALVDSTPLENFKNKDNYSIFSFAAYADKRLLIKNNPSDARNRRVDLRIILTYKPSVALTR